MKYLESLKKILTPIKMLVKKVYWGYIICFGLGTFLGMFFATHEVVIYKHDNPLEEMVEKILEDKFGIVFDMTPDSKEEYGKEAKRRAKKKSRKRVKLPKK